MGGEKMRQDTPDVEALADAILRAAGSGLRFYSMPSIRQAILRATEAAVQAGRDEGAPA